MLKAEAHVQTEHPDRYLRPAVLPARSAGSPARPGRAMSELAPRRRRRWSTSNGHRHAAPLTSAGAGAHPGRGNLLTLRAGY